MNTPRLTSFFGTRFSGERALRDCLSAARRAIARQFKPEHIYKRRPLSILSVRGHCPVAKEELYKRINETRDDKLPCPRVHAINDVTRIGVNFAPKCINDTGNSPKKPWQYPHDVKPGVERHRDEQALLWPSFRRRPESIFVFVTMDPGFRRDDSGRFRRDNSGRFRRDDSGRLSPVTAKFSPGP